MGIIGEQIGQYGLGTLGEMVGKKYGGSAGASAGKKIGSVIGGVAGSTLISFKTGGKVPGKRGKPVKALVHGGEYILPAGVKPTASQKMAVAKLHKKKKM